MTRPERGSGRVVGFALLAALCAAGAGCEDETTSPPAQEPFTVTWRTGEPGRASFLYGESSRLPWRIAYETASPGSTHTVRLLGVEAGTRYQGRWRLHRADGSVLEEAGFLFDVARDVAPAGVFHFRMIDVGWGDAHLLTTPEGVDVLIDAGRPDRAAVVVDFLRSIGIEDGVRDLDGVVLTHPDCDHVGGFVGSLEDPGDGVLENFTVAWALEGEGVQDEGPFYVRFRDLLDRQGADLAEIPDGSSSVDEPCLRWDAGLAIHALNSGNQIGDGLANNGSIVLQIIAGGVTLLTGGDAQVEVERRLLDLYGERLASHVLKVHHHGNSDASLEDFIRAVRPFVALVPIARGDVVSSMPSGEVLERLRDAGADILRSDRVEILDLAGGYHVFIWTDGSSLEVGWQTSGTSHDAHPDCP